MKPLALAAVALVLTMAATPAAPLSAQPLSAQIYNLKVVTDATPDYTDMDSMIRSITGKWPTMKEKCWAMFYWVHLARRQVMPMMLHGTELGDPIRQFNDYGYAMCSTVAGINDSIWNAMGLKIAFCDISMHTVSECYYDDGWHVYDNSMSCLYTLCDGTTVAGIRDVGRELGCEASGGKVEPGHIARYHCLNAGSPDGFLTGADSPRELAAEYACFNPKGLKYRTYWCGWEQGHRYLLTLRDGEVYTRYYHRLDKMPAKGPDGKTTPDPESPRYYVPNYNLEDPARKMGDPETGFHIRANGRWVWRPSLGADYKKQVWAETNTTADGDGGGGGRGGVHPARAGAGASVTWRVHSANVTTSMAIDATIARASADDAAALSVSTDNGLHWAEVWKAGGTGDLAVRLDLVNEVNGGYETLLRLDMTAKANPADVAVRALEVRTVTMLNGKTQPRLNLGKNIVYVGAGEQADAIALWPDTTAGGYRALLVDSENLTSDTPEANHWAYVGNLHSADRAKPCHFTYRLDAPGEITQVVADVRYSSRHENNAIDLLWSLDEGTTWTRAWRVTEFAPPTDRLRHETIPIPPGHRSVRVRYAMTPGASIFSTRLEARFKPAPPGQTRPVEVTFTWKERQGDRSLVERSHTRRVDRLPARYEINVGGEDHPVMESLQVNLAGSAPVASARPVKTGYSDGQEDAGATKFVHRWQTVGTNFARGRPYTTSVPSGAQFGAAGPNSGKLTDGVVGSWEAGGAMPRFGEAWSSDTTKQVDIDVDLGQARACGAFRIHMTSGWPWPDALRGQWKDTVEVFTRTDGQLWASRGFVKTSLRYKDIAINYFLPDGETLQGCNFELVLPKPVECRHVRWRVTPVAHTLVVTEVQALDFIRYQPFDIRLALPDEDCPASTIDPATLTPK